MTFSHDSKKRAKEAVDLPQESVTIPNFSGRKAFFWGLTKYLSAGSAKRIKTSAAACERRQIEKCNCIDRLSIQESN